MIINLKNDVVTTIGKEEKLITTSCGHYCMPLPGQRKDQLADVMTERTASPFNLLSVFQKGRRYLANF